ncbi:hypothetical protein G5C51_02190 [Streptomyces sp. A7024]|uniref:Lipoprotein n=1 Tax=Streptomyces coryli TaxID=1128680 RepID=A0A6G4TSF5_9ACTN|nr:hypothetical protein [Streptomyces coryli]NGN62712.1 hypothetical protein [Streptomyces coryli]
MRALTGRGCVALLAALAALATGACGAGGQQRTADPPVRQRAAAATEDGFQRLAERVQGWVAKSWPRAGEVWPGADYSRRALILGDGKHAAVVDTKGVDRLGEAELRRAGVEVPQVGYEKVRWHGREAVVWNTATTGETGTDAARDAYTTGTHEAFHFYEQRAFDPGKQWPVLRGDLGRRSTPYPLKAQPRLQRIMLANELLAAATARDAAGRERHRRAAAYWQQQWAKDSPGERRDIRVTDIAEGTAEYFTTVMTSLAEGKPRGAGLKPLDSLVAIDTESYRIGAAAGLLADARGSDWKKAAETSGRTPAQFALAGAEPEPQQEPEKLRATLEREQKEGAAKVDPLLRPLRAGYRDRDKPLLLLPESAATGSTYQEDSFAISGIPYDATTGYTRTYRTKSGGRMQLDKATVLDGAAAGTEGVLIPFDPEAAQTRLTGGKVAFATRTAQGTVAVEKKTDAGTGRTVYVAH